MWPLLLTYLLTCALCILAIFCPYVIVVIIRLLLRASEGDPALLLSAVALRDVDEVLPHVPRAAHQAEEVFPRDAEGLAALVADARDRGRARLVQQARGLSTALLVRVRVRVRVGVRVRVRVGFRARGRVRVRVRDRVRVRVRVRARVRVSARVRVKVRARVRYARARR